MALTLMLMAATTMIWLAVAIATHTGECFAAAGIHLIILIGMFVHLWLKEPRHVG